MFIVVYTIIIFHRDLFARFPATKLSADIKQRNDVHMRPKLHVTANFIDSSIFQPVSLGTLAKSNLYESSNYWTTAEERRSR